MERRIKGGKASSWVAIDILSTVFPHLPRLLLLSNASKHDHRDVGHYRGGQGIGEEEEDSRLVYIVLSRNEV